MKLLFLVEKFSNEIFPICRLLTIVYRVFSLSKACKPFGTITLAQLLLKFDKFISSIFIFIFFNIMNRGTALNPSRLSIFQSPECRSFFFRTPSDPLQDWQENKLNFCRKFHKTKNAFFFFGSRMALYCTLQKTFSFTPPSPPHSTPCTR